jgi:hypothetical protein
VFVHIGRSLYFPINLDLKPEVIILMLDTVTKMASARDELEKVTGDYFEASVMPIKRAFHKSRLQNYQ